MARSNGMVLIKIALVAICLVLGAGVFGSTEKRIKVHGQTSKSLLIILKGSESLHSKLVLPEAKRDSKKIREDASQIIQLVKIAIKTAKDKEPAENVIHLEKLLSSLEARLQDYLHATERATQRKMYFLREFFQHVTQIARQYDVAHDYRIFFCPRDKQKGTWIQKSAKAQNPFDFDGSLKNCGAVVH